MVNKKKEALKNLKVTSGHINIGLILQLREGNSLYPGLQQISG